ncbi:MAG: glycosyltransferase, partial [Burkholderiaceae bacterium]
MKLSVVIPVYNEEASVERLVNAIHDALSPSFSGDFELVLVDDGSRDSTAQSLKTLALS